MVAILIALIGAAAFFWFQPQPITVSVVTVERGEVRSTVANTRAGTVDACRRAGLAPGQGGQMSKLLVKEGDQVKTGELLLELWNDDLRAELMLAEREAVASQARADEVCVRAEVSQQEAQRMTRLHDRGLAAEEETDRAVGDAKAQAAACTAANDTVKVSDANVSVNQARLERSLLRAPFDGIIAEINGELGEFATPSPVGVPTPPTVDLIDTSCLYISAPIDEVDAPAVRAGQKAVITLDAFPDRDFSGFVRRVAPYVLDLEKQARTVEIEAEIDDPGASNLLPGYSADVEVILDIREEVIRVPTQVIIEGDKVFVLGDGIIQERSIEKGVSNWEYSEIREGLGEGDIVVLSVDREGVVDGAQAVRD
jgi:HlyD family secretion protein